MIKYKMIREREILVANNKLDSNNTLSSRQMEFKRFEGLETSCIKFYYGSVSETTKMKGVYIS